MRTIKYKTTSDYIIFSLFNNLRPYKKQNIARFLYETPYLFHRNIIPSKTVINEYLQMGETGGGMAPKITWEITQISDQDYQECLKYWQNRIKGKTPIKDNEILKHNNRTDYIKAVQAKYKK